MKKKQVIKCYFVELNSLYETDVLSNRSYWEEKLPHKDQTMQLLCRFLIPIVPLSVLVDVVAVSSNRAVQKTKPSFVWSQPRQHIEIQC